MSPSLLFVYFPSHGLITTMEHAFWFFALEVVYSRDVIVSGGFVSQISYFLNPFPSST